MSVRMDLPAQQVDSTSSKSEEPLKWGFTMTKARSTLLRHSLVGECCGLTN